MQSNQRVKPTQKQLEFLDWEFGVFFHFGIRSFFMGHKDWDGKPMPAEAFMPTKLDCEQWIRAGKEAGARYAVLTAKHHDGFALWPSKYTDYSVASSPWREGKGDVVAEYVAACRKHGLKVGIYYSPAQWGGGHSFEDSKGYDDYFIDQISELLTNYGEIDYLWFDGCGSEDHVYDEKRIVAAIRSMQPGIRLFNMWDPDTRWVGNEDGYAQMPNPNTVRSTDVSVRTSEQVALSELQFLPAECDMRMRDFTWFDCEPNAHSVKSVEELMGVYELSVGRGANMLINIGPNSEGLLPEPDEKALRALGAEIERRYGRSLPAFGPLVREENGEYTLTSAEGEQLVDRVVLGEDLRKGEAVSAFSVYAQLPFGNTARVKLYRGETIGHKAICLFPTIRTAKLIVVVEQAEGEAKLMQGGAYFCG